MRKLFELGQDVSFRIFSDEIRVSDQHNKLNDNQLLVIAEMFWGADVKTEIVRTIETITTIRTDSSSSTKSEDVQKVERIVIRKVAETK